MKKEIDFTIEGVQGDLKLEYGPFKQKLYQNGQLIQRRKGKYPVTTTTGETENIKIVYGLDFVHVACFRDRKYPLQERLSTTEYMLGGLPILLVFVGGMIGAFVGVMGAIWIYDYFRIEKRMSKQVTAAVGVSFLCFLLYLALAIPFSFLMTSLK